MDSILEFTRTILHCFLILDSRPAPPPYLSGDPALMETFQSAPSNKQHQDEGTYLV